jgi:hypothetical protein
MKFQRSRSVTKSKRFGGFAVENLEARQMLAAQPVITEFMASNRTTLNDGDGNSSDWVEVYNAGDEALNLAGWHLTDDAADLTKWTFGEQMLPAGEYLVVFASNQVTENYVDGQGNLHTNFQLTASGEYLALVQPDGATIASEFSPEYPQQYEDISYGVTVETTSIMLVDEGAEAAVLIPTDGSLGTSWTSPSFVPGVGWITETSPGQSVTTGVGYQSNEGDPNLVGYWPLDEVAGTSGNGTVIDVQGAQNGTPFGASSFGVSGAKAETGTSYEGSGASGGIRVPYSSTLNTASFTVTAWAYPNLNSGTHTVISSRASAGGLRGYTLYNISGRWQFWTGDGSAWDVMSGPLVTPNQWTHLAITFDASTGTKRLFRDGQQVGTSTTQGYVPNAANDFLIGAGEDGGTNFFFDGKIDDVSYFNTALDATEIASIWNSGVPSGGSSLVADAIATDVGAAMQDVNASAYVRVPFTVEDPAAFDRLFLRMKYNDGFVAYLNGSPIASQNAPAAAQWNSSATGSRDDGATITFQEFNITSSLPMLVSGQNVLAIHGLNASAQDENFLVLPQLEALTTSLGATQQGYFTAPTPGAPNPLFTDSLGPIIQQVEHTPAEPTPAEPVIVTAAVAATDQSIGTVQLQYRVMYGAEVSVPMNDAGTGSDAVAGDGIFTGVIPAGAATAGQMLRWYVTATDVSANLMRNPRIVDIVGTDRDPEYFGTVVADPTVTSNLPILHWFAQNPAAGRTRTGTRASVYFDGEFYDNIFVRQRGGATNGASQKFNFNDDQKFYVNEILGRVAEFNLNAQGSDPTYIRQPMAFESYRDAGNESSISFLMHTEVNGNFDRVGVFIEQVDEDFLERNGLDPEGALYKFVQRGNLNPVFFDTITGIEKKTRLEEDFSDVAALVAGLNLSTPEAREQFIFDNLNLPQIINYLALRSVTMDADDVRKNFYMYRDTNGSGEWSIFPWDKDWTFGIEGDGAPHLRHPFFGDQDHAKANANQWNVLYEVLFDNPTTREMFLRRIRTVMDQLLQPADTPLAERHYENRVDEVFGPAASELGGGAASAITALKSYFNGRRNDLYVTHSIDRLETGEAELIFGEDAAASYFVPSDDSLGITWTASDFDDSGWTTAAGPFGYEDASNAFLDQITTPVRNNAAAGGTAAFFRYDFNVDDPNAIDELFLTLKYDDAVVGYVNGEFAFRRFFFAGTPRYNSRALLDRANTLSANAESIDLSAMISQLRPGENTLAFYVLNFTPTDDDLFLAPALYNGNPNPPPSVSVGIPHEQVTTPNIEFGEIDFNPVSGNQDEEFIELNNPGTTAVDISGWRLEGGVEMTMRAGTVIPAGGSLYVSPDVNVFRARSTGPSGGQGLFIQGPFGGHLSNFGETVTLVMQDGTVIDTVETPSDASPAQQYLRISEILYNPAAGLDTEFIELTNISSGDQATTLDLGGVTLSDGPSVPYVIPAGTMLAPGEFLILAANPTAFTAAYPHVTQTLLGPFEGSLSNGGELIKLNDAVGGTIVEVTYGDRDPWPQQADSVGTSLEVIDPTATPRDEFDKPYRWRGSGVVGGTPGTLGAGEVRVIINEVLANTDDSAMQLDAIEIYNDSGMAVDLSGWYLSDSADDLLKYAFPAGTLLGPGAYLVIDESQFNPTPASPLPQHFSLNGATGDDVWLVRTDGAGVVLAVVDEAHFSGTPVGVSLGRSPNASGRLAPQSRGTLGCSNMPPAVSGVVISEVQYHPVQPSGAALQIAPNMVPEDLEFIELYNATATAIDLGAWELTGGVDYVFSPGTMLEADETLLVIKFNPASLANAELLEAFRAHYSLDSSVRIVGGYGGTLSDSHEIVRLRRPLETDSAEYVVDEVYYDDRAAWPVTADGAGDTLQRGAPLWHGNLPTSWTASAPSPGTVNFSALVLGDLTGDGIVDAHDIDLLAASVASGTTIQAMDLDDNAVVDAGDVLFLVESVLDTKRGDANLDGVVDARDFNLWNAHKFQSCAVSWSEGDFNGDGAADASDFNLWNAARFTSAAPASAAAPVALLRVPRAAAAMQVVPWLEFATARSPAARLVDQVHVQLDDLVEVAPKNSLGDRWRVARRTTARDYPTTLRALAAASPSTIDALWAADSMVTRRVSEEAAHW